MESGRQEGKTKILTKRMTTGGNVVLIKKVYTSGKSKKSIIYIICKDRGHGGGTK